MLAHLAVLLAAPVMLVQTAPDVVVVKDFLTAIQDGRSSEATGLLAPDVSIAHHSGTSASLEVFASFAASCELNDVYPATSLVFAQWRCAPPRPENQAGFTVRGDKIISIRFGPDRPVRFPAPGPSFLPRPTTSPSGSRSF